MKSYKTEVKLNKEQEIQFNKTVGTCRFIYNFYISYNKEIYEKEKKFTSAYDFSKYLNNEFLPNNKEYSWIKEVSSKTIKQSIQDAEKAFKNFFKGLTKFPKFKKKKDDNIKYYFVRNSLKQPIKCHRHKINIPKLKYVHIKEKDYLPKNNIISGTVSRRAGRYFVSVTVDEKTTIKKNNINEGIGLDLGINKFIVSSNNLVKENINKTNKVKKLEKSLKRQQRKLSKRIYGGINYSKQKLKIQRLHYRLDCIRKDYIKKCVNEIVKTKPSFITLENLNIKGMLKNKHLSDAIRKMNFFYFKEFLKSKCFENSIELREVNMFYSSSKLCSCCGNKKLDLKLKDRVYKCSYCNLELDRDLNASINLRDSKDYKILVPMACQELTTMEC